MLAKIFLLFFYLIFTICSGNRTREKSCPENLLHIFGNQLPQPSYLQKIEEQVECGICYAQYLPTGSIFNFQFVGNAIAATTHETKQDLHKVMPIRNTFITISFVLASRWWTWCQEWNCNWLFMRKWKLQSSLPQCLSWWLAPLYYDNKAVSYALTI